MPINIKHLRENSEFYKENERKRFRNPDLIDREFIPFVKSRPENLAKQRTARGLEKKKQNKFMIDSTTTFKANESERQKKCVHNLYHTDEYDETFEYWFILLKYDQYYQFALEGCLIA